MTDPSLLLPGLGTAFAALGLASLAGLKGWRGWLELKRLELSRREPGPVRSAAVRFDIADLRERVRKLEAIASGSDG